MSSELKNNTFKDMDSLGSTNKSVLSKYSEKELLELLKTESVISLILDPKNLKDNRDIYQYLCDLAKHQELKKYKDIKYKVLKKDKLDEVFKDKLHLLENFLKKCPIILKKDPLVVDEAKSTADADPSTTIKSVTKLLKPGTVYLFYRDYEKIKTEYVYCRVLS